MRKLPDEVYGGEIVERRSNSLLGVVGALGGALIGAVLWVLLYQIGIIASIAGIAIIFFACKGYTLLSKSDRLGGVILSILVSVVVLVATVFFCWGLDIYNELSADYAIKLFDALLFVPQIVFAPNFIMDFMKELLIGLVLIGVGATPFLRQAIHSGSVTE